MSIKFLLILISFILITSPLSAGGNRWSSKPPVGSVVDWSHPLSRGLVGAWLMNEGGGLIVNDIARKNNGTITNGALWKPAKRGVGIDFDGTNDYVNCGDVDITGGITIYVWVNGDIWGTTSTYAGIVAKRPAATTANYVLDVDAGVVGKDEVRFYFNDGNWHIWNSNNADFANGISYHIVITYDQTNDAIIYKNGSTVGVTRSVGTASGTLTANTGNLYIGWQEADNAYWDGRILEVAIWNIVLTASQIQQLYQDPYCFIKPPTIWSMFSTAVAAARRRIGLVQ